MNKKRKKRRFFASEKVNRMLDETARYWLIAVCIFNFLCISNNPATDKPSELSFVLKEYNSLLACLSVAFAIFLVLKLIEFYLIHLKSEEIVPKGKSVLSWLIKDFHISYKGNQLVLKNETILLGWQFMFCVFGFFIELKWYVIGNLGMILYLCIYITLSFQDIRNLFIRNNFMK